jgi:uncharacterized protein YjbI with pentapeptide repeats
VGSIPVSPPQGESSFPEKREVCFMMKNRWVFILVLVPLALLWGCNGGAVKDPPEFIEMFLDPESDVVFDSEEVSWSRKETDENTDTETTVATGPQYDGSFYSETGFEVIVVTNGENYDLLFSVELLDSLLGPCVYTDQSTLYHATSTVEVQTDGTYTTTVILTVPGSTAPETYLTERTITLSKILFSRDTVDGSFPADIPSNTTTQLLFEVHAREYFDETLGLPLEVNPEGLVDVVLTPESEFYSQAQTLGATEIDLPEIVNGYEIGKIYLEDLSWVESMSLSGASDDVFLLGDFSALTSLEFSAFSFPDMMSNPKDLTLNGSFPVLTEISLDGMDRYNFFLCHNSYSQNEDYQAFVTAFGTPLYAFPELATLQIVNFSRMGLVRIGKDGLGLPFPSLSTITLMNAFVSDLEIGEEGNQMDALTAITVTNTQCGSLKINGTKSAEESPATLTVFASESVYTIQIRGSIIGTINLSNTTLSELIIDGGTVNDSRISSISLQYLTFPGGAGTFQIKGFQPALLTLALADLDLTSLLIGDIGSDFSALQTLILSGLDLYNLYIGERDTVFSALQEIAIDDIIVDYQFRIGGENVDFPELTEIGITNSTFHNFNLGGSDFDKVISILIDNCSFDDAINLGSTDSFLALESIVLKDVSCLFFMFHCTGSTYDLYVDNLTSTNGINLTAAECLQVYVPEVDPTTWAYYEYVNGLAIPVTTGEYPPA